MYICPAADESIDTHSLYFSSNQINKVYSSLLRAPLAKALSHLVYTADDSTAVWSVVYSHAIERESHAYLY